MTEIMPFPKTIYCFIGPPLMAEPFVVRDQMVISS